MPCAMLPILSLILAAPHYDDDIGDFERLMPGLFCVAAPMR